MRYPTISFLARGVALAALAGLLAEPAAAQSFEFGGIEIPKDIARELKRHGIDVPTGRQRAKVTLTDEPDGPGIKLQITDDEPPAPAAPPPPRGPRGRQAAPAPAPAAPVEARRPEPQPERQAALPQSEPVPAAPAPEAALPDAPQPPAASAEAGVFGEWYVADKSARIAIAPCGDKICGKVAWSKTRERLGVEILRAMSPAGDQRWEGKILDPRSNKVYDSNVVLRSANVLRVEGCMMSFLCGGETWTRAQ